MSKGPVFDLVAVDKDTKEKVKFGAVWVKQTPRGNMFNLSLEEGFTLVHNKKNVAKDCFLNAWTKDYNWNVEISPKANDTDEDDFDI